MEARLLRRLAEQRRLVLLLLRGQREVVRAVGLEGIAVVDDLAADR
jgi:hypothetical protein